MWAWGHDPIEKNKSDSGNEKMMMSKNRPPSDAIESSKKCRTATAIKARKKVLCSLDVDYFTRYEFRTSSLAWNWRKKILLFMVVRAKIMLWIVKRHPHYLYQWLENSALQHPKYTRCEQDFQKQLWAEAVTNTMDFEWTFFRYVFWINKSEFAIKTEKNLKLSYPQKLQEQSIAERRSPITDSKCSKFY